MILPAGGRAALLCPGAGDVFITKQHSRQVIPTVMRACGENLGEYVENMAEEKRFSTLSTKFSTFQCEMLKGFSTTA